jgi:hypothetical protein
MTRRRPSPLAVIVTLCLGWASPAFAAPPTVSFDDSERLFVQMAWLNWVADEDPEEAKEPSFPVRTLLRQRLATLAPTLKARHRQAYLRMAADSTYLRNSLFLLTTGLYGDPPHFDQHLTSAGHKGSWAADADDFRDFRLPEAALLQEFCAAADLHVFWLQSYLPALKAERTPWEAAALTAMAETQDLLHTPIDRPVVIQANLLGHYGIAGETTFAPWRNRFEIKITPESGPDSADSTVQVLRHELTHVLMNEAVLQQTEGIQKIKAVAAACHLRTTSVPEMMAQSIATLSYPPGIWESLVATNRNLLFWHLTDHLQAFKASGLSFPAYLPTLFRAYDVAKEVARWQANLAARKAQEQAEDAVDTILDKEEERGTEATLAAFADVTRQEPDNLLAWYWLGVITWRDLRQAKPAREALDHVQKADESLLKLPSVYRPWFHYWQASIAQAEGRKDDAIAAWRRVQALTAATDDLNKKAAQALTKAGVTP